MSALFDAYLPQSVHTLAFASSTLAKVARAMASGQLHDHLLLHGEPGCGKSHLATLIVAERYPRLSLVPLRHEGSGWGSGTLTKIDGQMYLEKLNGLALHYTIINEVDEIPDRDLRRLKSYMDNTPDMKFVMTTNVPARLTPAFRNRANPHLMEMMPAADAVPIVQQAAVSLGKSASASDAAVLIATCKGSWRTLERFVRQL